MPGQELEFYRTAGPVEWEETKDGYQWKWRQPANTFWDERSGAKHERDTFYICPFEIFRICFSLQILLCHKRKLHFAQAESLRPRAERCGSKSKSKRSSTTHAVHLQDAMLVCMVLANVGMFCAKDAKGGVLLSSQLLPKEVCAVWAKSPTFEG